MNNNNKHILILTSFSIFCFIAFILIVPCSSGTVTFNTYSYPSTGTYTLITITGNHSWNDVYNADTGGTGHQNITYVSPNLYYFSKDCYFNIGDGIKKCSLNITDKVIYFRMPVGWLGIYGALFDFFTVKNLSSINTLRSSLNFEFKSQGQNAFYLMYNTNITINQSYISNNVTSSGSLMELFYGVDSTVSRVNAFRSNVLQGTMNKINLSSIDSQFNVKNLVFLSVCKLNADRTNIYNTSYVASNSLLYNINDLKIEKSTYSIVLYGKMLVKNSTFINCNYVGRGFFSGSNNVTYRDCKSNVWSVYSSVSGVFIRQYTYILKVVENNTGINLSGAHIVIKNKYNTIVYDGTTDSYGNINDVYLNNSRLKTTTWTYYNPYTITIYKNGYQTNSYNISIDEKTKHTIALVKNISAYSHAIVLYENIINADGTHESQYNNNSGWIVWANYTGNNTGSQTDWIILHNPNPANGTTFFNSNFIAYNPDGIAMSIDLNYSYFPDNLHLNWVVYNSTMDIIDADTVEDVLANGTYQFHSNVIGTENETYYWYIDVWSNELSSTIYTTKLYTFTTGFQSDNFLYIAGLSLNPEMFLFMIWLFFLWVWFKSESWEITALVAMILAPYSVIIGFYMIPIFLDGVDSALLIAMQILPSIISIIIIGFTIDSYHKRHKK